MKSLFLTILLIPIIWTSGCSILPETGQAADSVTTTIAVNSGFAEANPLMAPLYSHPAGVVAATTLKVGLPILAKELPEDACRGARTGLSGLGWGAAVWNSALILGAGTGVGAPAAISSGLVAGTLTWNSDECNKPFSGDLEVVKAESLMVGDKIYHFDGVELRPWSSITRVDFINETVFITTRDGWTVSLNKEDVTSRI